jgi:hypothetical protein
MCFSTFSHQKKEDPFITAKFPAVPRIAIFKKGCSLYIPYNNDMTTFQQQQRLFQYFARRRYFFSCQEKSKRLAVS